MIFNGYYSAGVPYRSEVLSQFGHGVGAPGLPARYTEHLLGWGHWVGSTALFRPELRYEKGIRFAGVQ